jgi:protein phosphatase
VTATSITTTSLSDVGQVRTRNEDFCSEFSHPSGYRLLVVADGMGGHRAGATASRVAVEAIGDVFSGFDSPPEEMLELALLTANRRVHQMALEQSELRGMGTTAVALLLGPDDSAWVAHIGDSRAYRYRDGRFEPLTADHSVVGEMERRGLITPEEAAVHPRRNEIMRCVGIQAEVQADIARIDVRIGDRYLLCSDGLSGLVPDPEIAAMLAASPPKQAAQQLVDAANRNGGHDNVTVQIASIHLPGELPASEPQVPRGSAIDATAEMPSEVGVPIHIPLLSEANDTNPLRGPATRTVLVVGAVVLAGLAALTLLWKVYEMNAAATTAHDPPTVGAERAAGAE